jgi:hypothetical protein
MNSAQRLNPMKMTAHQPRVLKKLRMMLGIPYCVGEAVDVLHVGALPIEQEYGVTDELLRQECVRILLRGETPPTVHGGDVVLDARVSQRMEHVENTVTCFPARVQQVEELTLR